LTTTEVVDDIMYSFVGAPSWTRTTVADEHKLSAVRKESVNIFGSAVER